jgi:CubicO group peptidase (beta-lactamase class C family)
MTVEGTCDPRFEEIHREFERSFAERGEVGASVCVTVDGETVVDLWGGVADPETGSAWKRDTVGVVWSSTKGATALCAHILASRGELDFGAPVASYWPEFGKNGKGDIPVRMLLNHQAGLAATREPLPMGGLCDWELVTETLAGQEPLWEPGTRHGYHALVFGHLIGEVVRRVTDVSIGTFFRTEVAEPLGLDFWIGLPEQHESRVAPNISADPPAPGEPIPVFYQQVLMDPASLPAMVVMNSGGFLFPGAVNTREVHAAEIPAANGITNARGLAGMYRPLALGGSAGGVTLVGAEQLVAMGAVSSASSLDAVLQIPGRWTLGYTKTIDNRWLPGPEGDSIFTSEEAFGHPGMGGSFGFADPKARMSFAYTMNRQGTSLGIDDRCQSLIDGTYRALGYRQANGGVWFS